MSEPEGVAPGLLQRASRSMFWNALLLPTITAFNLVMALVIRRYFGLGSGRYDVVLGLVNSLIMYTALGLPDTIAQFVPRLEGSHGRATVKAFLRRVYGLRFAILLLVLVPVNLLAEPIADTFTLGQDGATLVRLASLLTAVRALTNLLMQSLQALLEHLWANLVQLLQAVLGALVLVIVLLVEGDLVSVFAGLVGAGVLVALVGGFRVRRATGALPPGNADTNGLVPGVEARTFAGFGLFMYMYAWLNYFVSPAFASPAIAAVAGDEAPVALFNVGLQLPLMIVVVVLAGFQGLYRPLFSRLMDPTDREPLRSAYREISKVQAVVLIPSCVGLWIVADRLIVLMFTAEFAAAVPIARVLVLLLMGESLFNLGMIVLSVDRRYRDVVAVQSIRVLSVVPFIWLAADQNVVGAALVFGGARFLSALAGHLLAARRYGVNFPTLFTLRTAVPTLVMFAVLLAVQSRLGQGWSGTLVLVALGATIVAIGSRMLRVLREPELDLIRRAGFPGSSLVIRWFR